MCRDLFRCGVDGTETLPTPPISISLSKRVRLRRLYPARVVILQPRVALLATLGLCPIPLEGRLRRGHMEPKIPATATYFSKMEVRTWAIVPSHCIRVQKGSSCGAVLPRRGCILSPGLPTAQPWASECFPFGENGGLSEIDSTGRSISLASQVVLIEREKEGLSLGTVPNVQCSAPRPSSPKVREQTPDLRVFLPKPPRREASQFVLLHQVQFWLKRFGVFHVKVFVQSIPLIDYP